MYKYCSPYGMRRTEKEHDVLAGSVTNCGKMFINQALRDAVVKPHLVIYVSPGVCVCVCVRVRVRYVIKHTTCELSVLVNEQMIASNLLIFT